MSASIRLRAWLPRALASLGLLAVMLLGALAHGQHHLSDHACEESLPSHADSCAVCAALHAAPMPEASATHAAPAAVEHRAPAPAESSAPDASGIALAPARAPPVA